VWCISYNHTHRYLRWHWSISVTLGFWLICVLRCYSSTNSRIDRTERIASCYFTTDSWIDRSERITLRWFVPYNNLLICSPLLVTLEWLFVACWGIVPIMLLLLRELALVKVWTLGLVSKHCNTVSAHFYRLLPCCFYIFILQIPIYTIHTALVSPSLHRTSALIQFTIVLGVLRT